ncbi:MAG: amidohydrolase family protein [Saprospiraceae bacterium]|nr:amidohydrolase family protein [Saprospiraceae bacterium]
MSGLLAFSLVNLSAQVTDAPARSEGKGPFKRLILRGVTLINSTGAPPVGPVDIVIEGHTIKEVSSVGYPGVPVSEKSRPPVMEGDEVMDCSGFYALPGFVDMHGHIGGKSQGTPSEYVFKLWLAHGITTVRDPGSGNGLDWNLQHKKRSDKNEITAPRLFCYTTFGQGWEKTINTEEEAISWVKENASKGADGIKFFGAPPKIFASALKENKKLGLRSACHHAQLEVARMNVLASADAGLTSMEHWYGLPEALFDDRTIQDYPADYNYNNEQNRFEEAGKLWKQAAGPGSDRWNFVMDALLKVDFTLDPTFNIYEANRDLMRARNADWHKEFTLPSLWKFYAPSRISHGSYWFDWGTEQEIQWRQNYQLWMQFVNEYKNKGGRVTAGSDSGFIYQLYGFGYIRELELLREAGFHPLEVIRAATLKGAEALGADSWLGSIEPNKRADIILIKENPLSNLKYLFGTGTIKINDKNEEVMAGGIDYTIKDGIIYDARKLLEDVKEMVKKAKEE